MFLAGLYRAEQAIAERLRALAQGSRHGRAIDAAKAIPWVEGRTGLALRRKPEGGAAAGAAIQGAGHHRRPRGGQDHPGQLHPAGCIGAKRVAMALCAPTGRAAKRLSESTGLEAKTIHRLLETDPKTGGFKRGEENPLDCHLLVVDETSMVDVPLMRALLALPDEAALLLVGDVDQLPSVGPGQVLADIIGSGAVPVVRLTEVFRQAAESQIIVNAHRINQGKMPELDAPGRARTSTSSTRPTRKRACASCWRWCGERIPTRFGFDPVRDVQVLCPMNRGGLGARSLNIALQRR